MARYELKLEQFSGPLEKLLELIEEQKLEITTINLAQVTGDFLDYLKTLAEDAKHPSVIADFVVVASRLLLIKSKAILPNLELTEEEEREIGDLEARLKIYKEYKTAATHIQKLWNRKKISFSRPLFHNLPKMFYPPEKLSVSDLETAVQAVVRELQKLVPEEQSIKKIVISIKEKMEELLERFKERTEHSFNNLTKTKPKMEIIVMFLAILHLLRDRIIQAEQNDQFSDIIIKK